MVEIRFSAVFFDFWHKFQKIEWRQIKNVKILLTFCLASIRILNGKTAFPGTQKWIACPQ